MIRLHLLDRRHDGVHVVVGEHEVGGVQAAREVRRARREVDPDEDHLAVAQLALQGLVLVS